MYLSGSVKKGLDHIVHVINEFLVSEWGVNGTYTVGRASTSI